MADLNGIISKNARLAFERAKSAPPDEFGVAMSRAELSRRMTRRLFPEIDEHDDTAVPNQWEIKRKSLYRMIDELLSGKKRWRSDYLQAFCDSVGTFPERLVSPDYDGGKVSEATAAALLGRALGRRLTGPQARRLNKVLNASLDRPGMFELVAEVSETILAAPDAERADARTGKVIQKRSAAFERKQPKNKRMSK